MRHIAQILQMAFIMWVIMAMVMTMCCSRYSNWHRACSPFSYIIIYVLTATVECRDHSDGYGYDDDYDDDDNDDEVKCICKTHFSPQYVKICHWSRQQSQYVCQLWLTVDWWHREPSYCQSWHWPDLMIDKVNCMDFEDGIYNND